MAEGYVWEQGRGQAGKASAQPGAGRAKAAQGAGFCGLCAAMIECAAEIGHIAHSFTYSGSRPGSWNNEARDMKKLIIAALSAAMLAAAAPAPVTAAPGVINRACQKADRKSASPQLCGCIQKVANSSLSMGERRKVAKWFKNPAKAEKVRMSDRGWDELLWKRYKAFGKRANAQCGVS
jgi:hypothetical protein